MTSLVDILILQHHTDAPAGSLIKYLEMNGHSYRILSFNDTEQVLLPSLNEFKCLVIQGGAMNVDEESRHPWLKTEKTFILDCIKARKKILGICFGGQLIAEALGAAVHRHSHWELGWHAVQFEGPFLEIFKNSSELKVFQWHGYRFHIPPHAIRVATNSICEAQAYIYNKNIIGLQFHPESTIRWIRECAATPAPDYPTGDHVQTPEEILVNAVELQRILQLWYFQLLDYWMTLPA